MQLRRILFLCALAAVGLAARPAAARDVYLNGVKLDSNVVLTNQRFDACEVQFDGNGNVYITAKGFKVQLAPTAGTTGDGAAAKEPAAAPPADGKPTKRYWLVAPQPRRGQVQYDLDVYLNGALVKKVRSGDDRVVLEVTAKVKAGENRVKVVATKNMGNKRASSSVADTMEIVLGEGTVGGGTVMIDKPVVTYKRNASETGNFADDFTFTGR